MKRIETLNEEINKIQHLIFYKKGGLLKEEEGGDYCTGSNPIENVVVSIKQSETNNSQYGFSIRAFFPSTGSSDKVYENSLKTLKDQLLNNLDDDKKEKINKGTLGISIVKINEIWGSASNYLNGPLIPTKWNNRTEITTDYKSTVPKIKDKIKDKNSEDWKKNLQYAENRGNNFLNWITKSGTKQGISLKSDLEVPKSNVVILDTGGCIDEKRDVAKYKNSGQNLIVRGVLQLVKIERVYTDTETKTCLSGSSISIGYVNDGSHKCDYAIFNVYANKVLLGVANLNNGDLDVGGTVTDYTENRKSDGVKGGTRSTEFVLTDEQITEIAKNSENGRVVISIKGFPSTWYKENSSYEKEGATHSDTPTVVIKLNGKVKYNKKPQAEMKRVNTPEETPIYSFIPCQLA